MLNVDPWCVDLLEELQMRVDDGVLKVSEAFKDRGDTLQLITTCLLQLLCFRRFSDSRWLTLGDACRALVAAELCGLSSLVKAILDDPGRSNYYIGGFKYFDQ